MIEYVNEKEEMLSKSVLRQKGMTYGKFMSILKKKNIKINGQKTNKDILIKDGDKIVIYGFETVAKNPIKTLYEDDNIIVVIKPKGIQVKREDVSDNKISIQEYFNATPVHRLDRNTEGLLILAKNKEAEEELIKSFKSHSIEKYYMALVYGKMPKTDETLNAFIAKDRLNNLSRVYDKKVENAVPITTIYHLEKSYEGVSKIQIKLVTGKTHQIRAHMQFICHSVVGDSKYANKEYIPANKQIEKVIKSQCLIAYKLVMHFGENSPLYYLNNKVFEIDSSFEKELKQLGIEP